MEKEKFTLLLMKDAEDFLRSIPDNAKDKIYYNIYKIQMGERDSEIFKKLGESDIWEFRTLYDKKAYRLFAFLGHGRRYACDCYTWYCEEDPENSTERDCKS